MCTVRVGLYIYSIVHLIKVFVLGLLYMPLGVCFTLLNLRSPLRGSRERKTYISVYASVSFATRSPELADNFLFPWLYRRYRGGRGGWGGADTVKGGAHGGGEARHTQRTGLYTDDGRNTYLVDHVRHAALHSSVIRVYHTYYIVCVLLDCLCS